MSDLPGHRRSGFNASSFVPATLCVRLMSAVIWLALRAMGMTLNGTPSWQSARRGSEMIKDKHLIMPHLLPAVVRYRRSFLEGWRRKGARLFSPSITRPVAEMSEGVHGTSNGFSYTYLAPLLPLPPRMKSPSKELKRLPGQQVFVRGCSLA